MSDVMRPITSLKVPAPIQSTSHRLYSSVLSIPSYIRRYSTGGEGVRCAAPSSCGVSTSPPTTHEGVASTSSDERPDSIAEETLHETDEDRRARVRDRFKSAVRTVMLLQSHTRSLGSPSLDWMLRPSPYTSRTPSIVGNVARRSVISVISKRLQTMECSQDLSPHEALVRDMQFSPDGKYLVTAR